MLLLADSDPEQHLNSYQLNGHCLMLLLASSAVRVDFSATELGNNEVTTSVTSPLDETHNPSFLYGVSNMSTRPVKRTGDSCLP